MKDEEVRTKLDKYFHKGFYQITDMVEQLFANYQGRLTKKQKKKKNKVKEEVKLQ